MKLQLKLPFCIRTALMIGWSVFFCARAHAEPCFDFRAENAHSLPIPGAWKPYESKSSRGDQIVSAQRSGGGYSGAVKGSVHLPIQTIVQKLQDIRIIKDPSKVEIKTETEARPGWIFFQRVKLTARPFLFVSVDWEEEWGFRVLAGTQAKPTKVLINYQKRSGTSHLKHFCGSILLTAAAPDKTELELIEEIDAPGRSEQDTVRGHIGTLETLRKLENPAQ